MNQPPRTRTIAAMTVLACVLVAPHRVEGAYSFTVTGVLTPTPSGSPNGAITGYFTTDDALTTVESYDIFASGIGDFSPTDSRILSQHLTSGFVLESLATPAQLALFFSPNLTATGATFTSAAGSEGSTQSARYLADGMVAAVSVPEPASSVLVASALLITFGATQVGFRRPAQPRLCLAIQAFASIAGS